VLSLPAGGSELGYLNHAWSLEKSSLETQRSKAITPSFLHTTFPLSARPCLVQSFIVPFLDISQAFFFCPPQSGHHVRSYDGGPLTVEDTATW
jgi:hypothetical protein